jgi:hypothetical protein
MRGWSIAVSACVVVLVVIALVFGDDGRALGLAAFAVGLTLFLMPISDGGTTRAWPVYRRAIGYLVAGAGVVVAITGSNSYGDEANRAGMGIVIGVGVIGWIGWLIASEWGVRLPWQDYSKPEKLPEQRPVIPETDDREPARWWEQTIFIVLVLVPWSLVWIVIDEPWYVDAPIVIVGLLLARVLITSMFPRMRANPEAWDDR